MKIICPRLAGQCTWVSTALVEFDAQGRALGVVRYADRRVPVPPDPVSEADASKLVAVLGATIEPEDAQLEDAQPEEPTLEADDASGDDERGEEPSGGAQPVPGGSQRRRRKPAEREHRDSDG